jgi:hypothetical protein
MPLDMEREVGNRYDQEVQKLRLRPSAGGRTLRDATLLLGEAVLVESVEELAP